MDGLSTLVKGLEGTSLDLLLPFHPFSHTRTQHSSPPEDIAIRSHLGNSSSHQTLKLLGVLILYFPAFRTVKKYVSVFYKFSSLRYFVIAA